MTTPERFTPSLNLAPGTPDEHAGRITLRCPKGHTFHLTPAEALALGHDLIGLTRMAAEKGIK